MEYLELYETALREMEVLKDYINKLENERDYYQDASEFAGVPNTPRPELLD